MQFKRSILAAAVGAALCASGPALALDPSVDGNPQLIVRLSGATAQDPIVGQAIARLCLVTAGVSTLDRYLIGTTQFGYYCSMSSATIPGLSGTLRVLVLKESVAGSGNGVTPLLAPGSTLAFEKIDTTTIGSCGATSAVGTVTVTGDPLGIPGFNSRTCSTAAVDPTPQRPIAGLSDVEPAFFTTANTTALAPTSANLLGFGVAVNEQLYRALQVAQGKDSTNTNAWPGNDPAVTGI
ncbi:MAG TPA: hypothetical protein VKE95_21650, partial [Burkholderiales bacterium]|nr:hypothetical protein [Burkholderiales bacterium]